MFFNIEKTKRLCIQDKWRKLEGPDKSVDKVLEITEGFKNNTLDNAEFWLEVERRMIFIRYFPMRDTKGEYQGVLEVTQDVTHIRKLEGEKRLL
ncbi:MAG: PAS domain-containing protein [Candidatus Heimdallarchaeaceae archaeon]